VLAYRFGTVLNIHENELLFLHNKTCAFLSLHVNHITRNYVWYKHYFAIRALLLILLCTCIDDFYLVKHHLICIFFAMAQNKRLYPNIFKKEIFYLCPFSLSLQISVLQARILSH
jgi:hypothetical protein